MLTPLKANRYLRPYNVSMRRSRFGYYYFVADFYVESIYSHNLKGFTIEEIVNHVKYYLSRA